MKREDGSELKEERGEETHQLNLHPILVMKRGCIILIESECNLPAADKKNQSAAPENSALKMIGHCTHEI